jgi:hypothetical protein
VPLTLRHAEYQALVRLLAEATAVRSPAATADPGVVNLCRTGERFVVIDLLGADLTNVKSPRFGEGSANGLDESS